MDDFEQLDHYALLGIAQDTTTDDLKRAYRRQMARFHPDRFVTAPPEEQAYAGRRAQQINRAYAVLSDLQARTAYDRGLVVGRASVQQRPIRSVREVRPSTLASISREVYLDGLYDQVLTHLVAGRQQEAIDTLHTILQCNPFYRDSAVLLARTLAIATPAQPALLNSSTQDVQRPGGVGALIVAGLSAAGRAIYRSIVRSRQVTPEATPDRVEENGEQWPTLRGADWSASPTSDGYQIAAAEGSGMVYAWSGQTVPPGHLIAADLQVRGGFAGLILHLHAEADLAFMISTELGSYRVVQHHDHGERLLLEARSGAIALGLLDSNRLTLRLQGGSLGLAINDQPVVQLQVASPPKHTRFGLAALAIHGSVTALFRHVGARYGG
jgi:hypothetical protein